MNEKKLLYLKLQQRVNAILPFIERVELIDGKVLIGKIEVSAQDFSKMREEFTRICKTPYDEEAIKLVQGNVIPIALVANNVFFREIQISLNMLNPMEIEVCEGGIR